MQNLSTFASRGIRGNAAQFRHGDETWNYSSESVWRDRPGKSTLFAASIVVAIGSVWAAHGPILRGAAYWWVTSDQIIVPADAVIVLGGGFETRPRAAADIFKRGYAKQVLVVNAEIERQRSWLITHDRTFGLLQELGVPAASLASLDGNAQNTYEEARLTLGWVKANGAHKLIIPTELFHTRRARWIFARVLRTENATVDVEAIGQNEYSREDWWLHREGWTAFSSEILKYLMYRIRY